MSAQDTGTFPAARPPAAFNPLTALDGLVSTVSAARAATGGAVSIAGQDPILADAHRMPSFVAGVRLREMRIRRSVAGPSCPCAQRPAAQTRYLPGPR